MKQLVCESLQEFFKLNENVETSKKIFQEAGIEESDPRWIRFKETFSQDPEYADLFAELMSKKDVSNSDFERILKSYRIYIKPLNILPNELDKNKFTSFREYKDMLEDVIEKKQEEKIEPKEEQNIKNTLTQTQPIQKTKEVEATKQEPTKIVSEKIPEKTVDKETLAKLQKEERQQKRIANEMRKAWERGEPPNLFGFPLYLYAVYLEWKGVPYVKFGETYQNSEVAAKQYAMRHTFGKASALLDADDLIFCEDVTDVATKMDPKYVYRKHQQFDDAVRDDFPGISGSRKNAFGIGSDELHQHKPEETFDQIKKQWKDALNVLKNKDFKVEPEKKYEARPFHKEMNEKITNGKTNPRFDKFLLAAATGSGKELATLEQIIHIHDTKYDEVDENGNKMFNENTIHVSVATIPSTELELFQELSKVQGMNMNSQVYTSFSRIVPYVTSKFAARCEKELPERAKLWFKNKVNIVGPKHKIKSIGRIPTHNKNEVPILFGSFPHLGMSSTAANPTTEYNPLKRRIGILSIGEAHKFLSNISNKMWPSIKKKYNFKFLLIITGTPYDYIFNNTSELYFSPNERVLFTRNELYEEKRKYKEGKGGDKAFADYPDIYYYQLNMSEIVPRIKEEMEANGEWEGDKNAFTYDKFFEIDKKTITTGKRNMKFKYENAIVEFFKRLLSSEIKRSTSDYDSLSIHGAPELCDYAKRHIIVALPVGHGGIGVHTYIPMLRDLLKDKNAFGNYHPLLAYEDNLKEIKDKIDQDDGDDYTITLTCNALLTGTNIPAWGSIIFLRSIGNSVKFFEQATGRVGRAFKKTSNGKITETKNNVGVFLGNMNNAMNLHVSVAEKIAIEKDPKTPYEEIIKNTLKNYYFFNSDGVEWQQITQFEDLQRALQEASGEVDYKYSLCVNNPQVPDNFDEKYAWHEPTGTRKVDITDPTGINGKTDEINRRVRQLEFEFDNKQDKQIQYRNMIKNHISKILIVCILKGFTTIKQFSEFINNAINTTDIDALEMIGRGVKYVPKYIDDPKQIDINYLNRWLERITRQTSTENTLEGMKERHHDINDEMDLTRLSESIIFDPLSLTDEICSKISLELKNANKILVFEKNGSFICSIIDKIGFENLNKLTVVIIDPLSEHIIKYIVGDSAKLINFKYIKNIDTNINELLNMGKFDVVIGNPPYQGVSYTENKGGSQASTALWPKFSKKAFEISNDIVALITPKTILKSTFFKNELNNVYYLNIDECSKHFHVGSSFVYFISSYKGNYSKKIKFFDGSEKTVENFNFLKGHDVTGKADDMSLSIIAKLNKFEKMPYKKGTAISINNIKFYNDKKSEKFPFECYYSSKEDRQKLFTKNKTEGYGLGNKLIVAHIFDFSEKNYDWFSTDKRNVGAGLQAGVLYFDKYDAENVKSYLLSNVVKFLNRFYRHGRYAYNVFRNLPKIDFSKKWTNKQLYKYFDLTQEQIDYIENI